MILWSRRQSYRPENLARLLERDRALFEHWTHDASVIPTEFFRWWKLRFTRDADRIKERWTGWQGADFHDRIGDVLSHVHPTGPVGTGDVGNFGDGISVVASAFSGGNVQIGGTQPGAGNIISANDGRGFAGSAANLVLEGNRVGTDHSGGGRTVIDHEVIQFSDSVRPRGEGHVVFGAPCVGEEKPPLAGQAEGGSIGISANMRDEIRAVVATVADGEKRGGGGRLPCRQFPSHSDRLRASRRM